MIGINDYVNFGDEEGGDLRGAEDDALRITSSLMAFLDMDADHIRLLLGRRATKDSIRHALRSWARARVGPEDRLIFYFSGHGSQVLDLDGDEADGLDESICPADALRDGTEQDIRDDELREWLSAVGAASVWVILDSCHSGTGTRAGPAYARSRSLSRQPDSGEVSLRPYEGDTDPVDLLAIPGLTEFAAAEAGQVALEVELAQGSGMATAYGGVFTTRLLRRMASLPPDATLEDLYWGTFHSVKAEGFVQDPQFTSPGERAPFRWTRRGDPETTELSEFRIDAIEGDSLYLSDGPAWLTSPGVVLGSRSGGFAVVVGATASGVVAEVLDGAVQVGERLGVVGVQVPRTELRLRVEPGAPRGALLAEALRAPGVSLAAPGGDPPHLSLTSNAQGDSVQVLGTGGVLRFGVSTSDPEGGQALSSFLRKEANAEAVRALRNPFSTFSLGVRQADGEQRFAVGSPITIEVRSARGGFLTLVDVGTDGVMTVLYPHSESGPLRVEAGVPRVFPESGFEIRATEPAGLGTVMAIVTPRPLVLDFRATEFVRLTRPGQLLDLVAAASPAATEIPVKGNVLNMDPWSWNVAHMVYRIVP